MRILTVREVGSYLNDLLATDDILSDLWVSGEISNFVRSAAGHIYFTLKDSSSQLKCVLFRRASQPGWLAYLNDGAAVIAHGRLAIYEASGALQFYIDLVQPEGVGLLHLQYEKLKSKLEDEGLFDVARKRKIPLFPKTIGVVTSTTGAVLYDIINVVNRRYPLADFIVCPSSVQGDGAAEEIVQAIETLNHLGGIDVIILARGGGSLEDLWPFNEECVARAIFASFVPVITGVGHETDFTIADMVADLRAPTPSAAAEMAVPDQNEVRDQVQSSERLLLALVQSELASRRNYVEALSRRLSNSAVPMVLLRQRVESLSHRAEVAMARKLEIQTEKLRGFLVEMGALNPWSTLQRGYAIVQNIKTKEIVERKSQVKAGTEVSITVSDGSFRGQVID